MNKLERDPRLLVKELDWVAKRHMIESYMDRKGCGWDDPRMKLMDLQYHDVRPEKGLFYTLERGHLIDRIVEEDEIQRAELNPPIAPAPISEGAVCGSSRSHCMVRVGHPSCSMPATTPSKKCR
ncbi:MAG: hypothetical protein HC801_06785 [Nitrospira sp.]|nr:hypothetical protein [Nitrospira sp.]